MTRLKLPPWDFKRSLYKDEYREARVVLRWMRRKVAHQDLPKLHTMEGMLPGRISAGVTAAFLHAFTLHLKGWYTRVWLTEWVQEKNPLSSEWQDDIHEVRKVWTEWINRGLKGLDGC